LSKIEAEQDNLKDSAKEIWARISSQLKEELPQINYNMWIKPIIPISINRNVLSLSVKSPFALKMLNERMSSIITRVSYETNHKGLEISFVVGSSPKKAPVISNLKNNDMYSFDSFVVGPSNELAFAASKQMANFSTPEYNPLYIYSNVGLGKTHLLQLFGHPW